MLRKVCIITSVHPAFDARIFHKEAKTLVGAGYEVVLIVQHEQNEKLDGIKIIPLRKPKSRFERLFKISKEAYAVALDQKADIYHFHDPELIPWMRRLKKKTGAKVIYDAHEDFTEVLLSRDWLPTILRKPASLILNWYEKESSKKFDYVIAATPQIRDKFGDDAVDIRNFPLISSILGENLQTREKWENKTDFTLIYAGGLEETRGVKEIIQSLSLLKQINKVTLEILGRFSTEDFKKRLERMDGWEKVNFLGELSVEDAYRRMNQSDIGLVCLHPLRRFLTSLPLKMFEYMAGGLPVVASNFPLWKEIVEGNKCGICVNPLDPQEIANAIDYLIEHPEKAKAMGENGRKAVSEKYNWESEGKKILNIYAELLK